MRDPGRTLILGAGPTGLGAAYRLQELGFGDFTLLEARMGPGGLARSVVDPHGFTWDVGGHVQFSHYRYYDGVLERLGTQWTEHEREACVWIKGRFVPYPFQNNLHHLDAADAERALAGLEDAGRRAGAEPALNFRDWIARTFGDWIAENFLYPYNTKVWGYPLERLGAGWVGERVAVPDLERLRLNIREQRDDVDWGPNRRFRYPLRGGTGAIWKGVAGLIAPGRMRFDAEVKGVQLRDKVVTLRDGERLAYDTLITSLPLDRLCTTCSGLDSAALSAARTLLHSSVHILGIGLEGERPESLATRSWMYFPEPDVPYYRVTVFSNYSPHNVPNGRYWSLMAEVCETPWRGVDAATLSDRTLAGLRGAGLIGDGSRVVSFWNCREEYGYPTPSVERDAALGVLLPRLEAHQVYSRGRFGAWKYEVSNQDHSFIQGVELADRLLGLDEERALWGREGGGVRSSRT